MEAEGSGLTLKAYDTLLVDQIEAVRPPSVGSFGRVSRVIDQGGQFDLQIADARTGNLRAFILVFGVGKQDLLAHVHRQLPAIGGMSFLNVDDEEIDLVAVLPVEFVEGGNLPPKGRSSIATEDQDHGFVPKSSGELNASLAIVGLEVEVRRM